MVIDRVVSVQLSKVEYRDLRGVTSSTAEFSSRHVMEV